MYKTNWGKVGEEILKKHPKITQMFDMLKYPKVLKYQLKPLISLKFKNQSTQLHKNYKKPHLKFNYRIIKEDIFNHKNFFIERKYFL